MESSYQTTNEDIIEKANNLKGKFYKELESTDNKSVCDFLIISHIDKKFFFTKAENKNHFETLLKTIN